MLWSNFSYQLYYLFSDSKAMKKQPKVILLGDTNVGKTSILQVLLHDCFQDKMSNTLGACFHRYESDDARGESIKMDIWDTAGQQKFRSLLTLYYKNSDAVVIVFDVNDPASFKTVDYWARQIDANCDSPPCIVLVGNKIDLRVPNSGVSKEQVGRYLAKRSKWEYIECSAKENFNIKQIFRVVGGKLQDSLAEKEKLAQASKMKIHPSKLRKDKQSSCC